MEIYTRLYIYMCIYIKKYIKNICLACTSGHRYLYNLQHRFVFFCNDPVPKKNIPYSRSHGFWWVLCSCLLSRFSMLYALAVVFVLLVNNAHLPPRSCACEQPCPMPMGIGDLASHLKWIIGPVPSPVPVHILVSGSSAWSFDVGSLNLFPPSSGRIPFNEDPNPNPHSSGPSTPLKNQIYSFSPSKSYSRQSSSSDTDLSLTPKTGKVLPPTLF